MLAKNEKEKEIIRFYNSLFEANNKYRGSVAILKDNKKYLYSIEKLRGDIESLEGKEDIFISPNTFLFNAESPGAKKGNVWSLNFLYMDLDIEKQFKGSKSIEEVYSDILDMAYEGYIPQPNMIINSGRGLHIYWNIGSYNNKISYDLWEEVQRELYNRLQGYGADKQVVTDSSRVLRVPGTVNSKCNKVCEIWFLNIRYKYNLAELKKEYCKKQVKKAEKIKRKPKKSIKHLKEVKSLYTLNKSRVQDLESLLKLRGNIKEGQRTFYLFILANSKSFILSEDNKVKKLINYISKINKLLKDPLSDEEVNSICDSVLKHKNNDFIIKNNILPGEAIDGKEIKGYIYKNESIIKILEITEEEQSNLVFIIGNKEIRTRNNKQRREVYKEKLKQEGKVSKKEEIEILRQKIKALRQKGFNNSEISKDLNIPIKSLEGHISIMKKTGLL